MSEIQSSDTFERRMENAVMFVSTGHDVTIKEFQEIFPKDWTYDEVHEFIDSMHKRIMLTIKIKSGCDIVYRRVE